MILLLASKPSRIALRHSSSNCRLRSYSSITNCSGGEKRQQKRNRTATKHLRHLLLVSDSAKAHVELLWGRRLGQSLIAELFTLNQVSVLKKVSAINPPFPHSLHAVSGGDCNTFQPTIQKRSEFISVGSHSSQAVLCSPA